MIEFRAACGHSIRAREEDAGQTVKCNYCGASVQVPDPSASALDYLFATEAEQAADRSAQSDGPGPKGGGGGGVPVIGGMLSQRDPVRLVMTFVYIGIVLVVVGVGGKMAWRYVSDELEARRRPEVPDKHAGAQGSPPGKPSGGGPATDSPNERETKGSQPYPMLEAGGTGLFINTVPSGSTVYIRTSDVDQNSDVDLGLDASEAIESKTPVRYEAEAGRYVVAVAMPRTHRDLTGLPEYATLLKAIRDDPTSKAALDYFIPDGAAETRVDRPPGAPEVFVRKYEVAVRKGKWTPVVGMFLPNLPVGEILQYLPQEKQCNVDAERVLAELALQDVTPAARPDVITALSKVGKAVYQLDNKDQYLVFVLLPDPDELLYSRPIP